MRLHARLLTVAILVSCIALPACARHTVSFADRGAAYTTKQLQVLLRETSTAAVASTTRGDAPELRHNTLVQLRSLEGSAAQAADTITQTFSASTAAVPVYVERATFNGADVLIVIEASAAPGGRLSAKRLWVMDANSGEIRWAASGTSGQ